MPFNGYLDRADQFALQGWAHCDSVPSLIPFVDIVVNRRLVACARAAIFREDLVEAKVGDGWRGFSFNPYESLRDGPNDIEVFIAGSDQLLPNGAHVVHRSVMLVADDQQAGPLPVEAARNALLDLVEHFGPFSPEAAILEIGPGGLARNSRASAVLPSYRGLRQEGRFDLVLCAGQSEHWYPSVAEALARIHGSLKPGGLLFLDFASHDAGLETSQATLTGQFFVRIYSHMELRMFFLEAGFELLEVVFPIPAKPEGRAVAVGRKPEALV